MSENNSVGEHPLERELDAGKEAESLLIKALRQYQHNDCSGLLVAYDYDETQKIVTELCQKIKILEDTNERMVERSLMLRKYVPLHERIVFDNEWREYIKSI